MWCVVAPAQEDLPVFRSRVDVVFVPVAVRYANGNTAANLKREDFELRDSGKRQKIDIFRVETRGGVGRLQTAAASKRPAIPTMPADAPERFIAYLFDDVHAEFGDLGRARIAAQAQMRALGPSDRVAIYTTSGTVMQEFTAERALIEGAFKRVTPHPQKGKGCPEVSYYLGNAWVNNHDPDALAVITTLVLACTPNMPLNLARSMAEVEARFALNEGEQTTRNVLATIRNVVQRMARLPGARSIVFASPGFINPQSLREQAALTDRALATRTVIHTLDLRGVYTDPQFDAAERGAATAAQGSQKRFEEMSQGAVLAELAESTGGSRAFNTNDLQSGFERLVSPPEVQYVLGFSSTAADGRVHGLKVTVRGCDGCSVTARKFYYATRRDEPARHNDPGVAQADVYDTPVQLEVTARQGGLSATAQLDVSALEFDRSGELYMRSIPVLFAVFDWDGNMVKSEAKRVEVKVTAATLRELKSRGLPVRANIDARPGKYIVRMVVADSERRVLAAVTRAVICE